MAHARARYEILDDFLTLKNEKRREKVVVTRDRAEQAIAVPEGRQEVDGVERNCNLGH
jgi:hypothetical protein